MSKNNFDPDNIDQSDMDKLAEIIENYIAQLEEVMIIPEELEETYGDRIRHSLETSKKLVKKLRKGDVSVFKDPDEWERYSLI